MGISNCATGLSCNRRHPREATRVPRCLADLHSLLVRLVPLCCDRHTDIRDSMYIRLSLSPRDVCGDPKDDHADEGEGDVEAVHDHLEDESGVIQVRVLDADGVACSSKGASSQPLHIEYIQTRSINRR